MMEDPKQAVQLEEQLFFHHAGAALVAQRVTGEVFISQEKSASSDKHYSFNAIDFTEGHGYVFHE